MEKREYRKPQDDLPYEQRMKHIIEHYRWLLDQNDKLAAYARSLEQKVKYLEKDLTYRISKNVQISEKFVEKNREVKRLRIYIAWLKEKFASQDNKEE